MLRNNLHTFSSKVKIFPSVTLWTDSKLFCTINCSFHCYFSKEVVKLYMCKNRKAKCMPLFFLPALETLVWEVCKMYFNCYAVCYMTWSCSSWGKYTHELIFFHQSDKQTSLGMEGVTKAAFFCHKAQNLRTSLGLFKYLKRFEIFAEDLTHEEQPVWSAQQHVLPRWGLPSLKVQFVQQQVFRTAN